MVDKITVNQIAYHYPFIQIILHWHHLTTDLYCYYLICGLTEATSRFIVAHAYPKININRIVAGSFLMHALAL